MDPALAGDRDDARRCRSTAATRRVASSRSFLPGLYGIAVPVQNITRFRPPDLHVLLLRPEEEQARPERQRRHEHERVGPAQVVEAVDGRAVGQPLATLQPRTASRPRVMADDAIRDSVVADRPADRVDRRAAGGVSVRTIGSIGRRSTASGSRSASRSSTRSANSAAPGAGGTLWFGTSTTVIPAARAGRGRRSASPRRRGSRPARRRGGGPPPGRRRARACRASTSSDDTTTSNASASPVASSAASMTARCADEAMATGRSAAIRRTASTAPVDARRALGPVARDHAVDDRALDLGLGQVEVEALAHRARPAGRVGAHHRGRSSAVQVRPCVGREGRAGPRPTRSRSPRAPRRGRR